MEMMMMMMIEMEIMMMVSNVGMRKRQWTGMMTGGREKVAQETMETLIDFMREHGISRKLEHRVQSFFHFKTR
eukprot:751007-Hanusia_phi.AAC.2